MNKSRASNYISRSRCNSNTAKAMYYQCRTADSREDANLLDDDDDDATRGSGSRFCEVVNHHSCKFMNLQQKM